MVGFALHAHRKIKAVFGKHLSPKRIQCPVFVGFRQILIVEKLLFREQFHRSTRRIGNVCHFVHYKPIPVVRALSAVVAVCHDTEDEFFVAFKSKHYSRGEFIVFRNRRFVATKRNPVAYTVIRHFGIVCTAGYVVQVFHRHHGFCVYRFHVCTLVCIRHTKQHTHGTKHRQQRYA